MTHIRAMQESKDVTQGVMGPIQIHIASFFEFVRSREAESHQGEGSSFAEGMLHMLYSVPNM